MALPITPRSVPSASIAALPGAGLQPLLARIYAARGVTSPRQLATDFGGFVPLARMHNLERMATLLADAIAARIRRASRLSGPQPLRIRLRADARDRRSSQDPEKP